VKIRSIRHNNRKKVFEVGTSTKKLVFPFSKATPTPTTEDPVTDLSVDAEAGREAFTYVLKDPQGLTAADRAERNAMYQLAALLREAETPACHSSSPMRSRGGRLRSLVAMLDVFCAQFGCSDTHSSARVLQRYVVEHSKHEMSSAQGSGGLSLVLFGTVNVRERC
jgi:hypothetical protein